MPMPQHKRLSNYTTPAVFSSSMAGPVSSVVSAQPSVLQPVQGSKAITKKLSITCSDLSNPEDAPLQTQFTPAELLSSKVLSSLPHLVSPLASQSLQVSYSAGSLLLSPSQTTSSMIQSISNTLTSTTTWLSIAATITVPTMLFRMMRSTNQTGLSAKIRLWLRTENLR